MIEITYRARTIFEVIRELGEQTGFMAPLHILFEVTPRFPVFDKHCRAFFLVKVDFNIETSVKGPRIA